MFLAQINCEELPENAIYPKKGIVQFWIFGGDYDMGNDYENPCSDINKRVLYYPTIEDHFSEQELTTLYKPKGDEDGDLCTPIMTDTPLSMAFKPEKQWPLLFDYRAGAVFVKKWNSHFPEQQVGSLCEINDIDEDLFGELYDALEIEKHTLRSQTHALASHCNTILNYCFSSTHTMVMRTTKFFGATRAWATSSPQKSN